MRLELPTGGERRYLKIAGDLAERIDTGEYHTGDRLPPERELAASLQVSRTTVREALLALELMRYVEIRIGAGVFVLPDSARTVDRPMFEIADQAGPFEILEARRLIEGEAAYRAAQRGTADEFKAIGRTIERMEAALDNFDRYDRADAEFHTLIARAAGNSLLPLYVDHLWSLRGGPMWERWYRQTRSIENRKRSVDEHRAIHQALKRGIPEMAATAMRAHIDVLAERFFQIQL